MAGKYLIPLRREIKEYQHWEEKAMELRFHLGFAKVIRFGSRSRFVIR